MSREVYCHVPDMEWPGWREAAAGLLEYLRRPRTTDEVLRYSLGPRFYDGLGQMGRARRTSLVRNMLAWLSTGGKIAHERGRWRRTRQSSVGKVDT